MINVNDSEARHDLGKELVGRFNKLRLARRLSIREAAAKIGVSYETVRLWIHTKASPVMPAVLANLQRFIDARGELPPIKTPLDVPRPKTTRGQGERRG